MIIPDINLLVYAHNQASRYHEAAKEWFETSMNDSEPIGLAWAVIFGFIRLLSNPKIVEHPDRPESLVEIAISWFDAPPVRSIVPGVRHLEFARRLYAESGCTGQLTTDVHIASLAYEFNGTVYSNDRDFLRFEGISVVNPLA